MNLRFFAKKVLQALCSLRYKDTYSELSKCDVLLICHDNDLGVLRDGKAYSPLIDSCLEKLNEFGWKCSRFLLPYTYMGENQAFASPSSANRTLFVLMLIHKVCILLKLTRKKDHSNLTIKSFYKTLFQRIECKCVIGIGLNSNICMAANELGLFSVEIAHGIGLPQLPFEMNSLDKNELPRGVITFDTISYNTFLELAHKGVEVKYTPHIWLTRFEATAQQDLPLDWKREIIIDKKYSKIILLTLQWGYDGEVSFFDGILENGILSPSIEECIEGTKDDVFWLIRMHPIQLRDEKYAKHRRYVEALGEKFINCEWQKASTLPLPAVLAKCHGHLTMSSMSTYEAAYMGIKTLLLCPTLKLGGIHQKYFDDLKTANMVRLGNLSVAEIVGWVNEIESTTRYSFSPKDTFEETIEWMLGRVRC